MYFAKHYFRHFCTFYLTFFNLLTIEQEKRDNINQQCKIRLSTNQNWRKFAPFSPAQASSKKVRVPRAVFRKFYWHLPLLNWFNGSGYLYFFYQLWLPLKRSGSPTLVRTNPNLLKASFKADDHLNNSKFRRAQIMYYVVVHKII